METEIDNEIKANRIYLGLIGSIDTTLIGIIIGIVSGVAVNLATADKIETTTFWAILLIGISVYMLIRLVRIRQKVDDGVAARRGEALTSSKKLAHAVDLKNHKRKRDFFFSAIFFIIFFGVGIWLIIAQNNQKLDEIVAYQELNNEIKEWKSRYQNDSLRYDAIIQQLNDSIQRQKSRENKNDTTRKKTPVKKSGNVAKNSW